MRAAHFLLAEGDGGFKAELQAEETYSRDGTESFLFFLGLEVVVEDRADKAGKTGRLTSMAWYRMANRLVVPVLNSRLDTLPKNNKVVYIRGGMAVPEIYTYTEVSTCCIAKCGAPTDYFAAPRRIGSPKYRERRGATCRFDQNVEAIDAGCFLLPASSLFLLSRRICSLTRSLAYTCYRCHRYRSDRRYLAMAVNEVYI